MDVELAVVGKGCGETIRTVERRIGRGSVTALETLNGLRPGFGKAATHYVAILPSVTLTEVDRYFRDFDDPAGPFTILVLTDPNRNSHRTEEIRPQAWGRETTVTVRKAERSSVADRIVDWFRRMTAVSGPADTVGMFDRAPEAMIVLDDDGFIRRANERAGSLLGPMAAPIVDEPFETFVDHGEFGARWREYCRGSIDRGTVALTRSRGAPVTVEFAARLDIEPGRHLLILRDVTGRIRSERALEVLHRTLRQLAQTDTKADICEHLVEAAETGFGYQYIGLWIRSDSPALLRPIACSEPLTELGVDESTTFGPQDALVWRCYAEGQLRITDGTVSNASVASPDAAIGGELLVPIGNHGILYVATSDGSMFEWTDVRVLQVLAGAIEPMLETLERECQLVERTRALRNRNERLDDVASVLSHDLRNPLNVAIGRVELLEHTEGVSEADIEPLRSALERMEAIISEVLSKAREGASAVTPTPVDLEEIVRSAWTTCDLSEMDLTIDGRLGTIEADPTHLRTLFENLFRNADEHGETAGMIAVGRLPAGGFYVADDGGGIPSSKRDRIFEYGYTTAPAGTGIGLSVVESIVEDHGWDIEVGESAAGGARFEITGV